MRISHILTPSHGLQANHCRARDNGKEFTDRLFGLRKRAATGAHDFDRLCTDLGIEYRLTPPMRPQPLGECAIHLPVSEPMAWSSGSPLVHFQCTAGQ